MRTHTDNPQTVSLIKRELSSWYAKNYLESAPFFNAIIETPPKRGYFIESRQFEDSQGYKADREYVLKIVAGGRIDKVAEFSTKHKAMAFFDELEFTQDDSLVLDRFPLSNRNSFDVLVKRDCPLKVYDNGLTCLYTDHFKRLILSYTEGDVVRFHCGTEAIFDAEVKRHHNFFLENEA